MSMESRSVVPTLRQAQGRLLPQAQGRLLPHKTRKSGAASAVGNQGWASAATKQIAHAASLPTLAKNARMEHPQWEWCTQRSLKVGYPPMFGQ